MPPTRHGSAAGQTTESLPTHAPDEQASARVQAFPSSHSAPSGAFSVEHAPVAGSQVAGT
jgi:hypothetical protein